MPERIIEYRGLQTKRMRVFYGVMTTILWLVYAYLWTPLLTLLAWLLGVRLFSEEMLKPANMEYLYELWFYFQVLLVLLVIVMGWSTYNVRRFRGVERRKAIQSVTPAEEAMAHEVPLELAMRLKQERMTRVRFGPRANARDVAPIADVGTRPSAADDRLPNAHGHISA